MQMKGCGDVEHLDAKVAKVQLTEDFMDNLQTFSIWNHVVILSCYVKILQNIQIPHYNTKNFHTKEH